MAARNLLAKFGTIDGISKAAAAGQLQTHPKTVRQLFTEPGGVTLQQVWSNLAAVKLHDLPSAQPSRGLQQHVLHSLSVSSAARPGSASAQQSCWEASCSAALQHPHNYWHSIFSAPYVEALSTALSSAGVPHATNRCEQTGLLVDLVVGGDNVAGDQMHELESGGSPTQAVIAADPFDLAAAATAMAAAPPQVEEGASTATPAGASVSRDPSIPLSASASAGAAAASAGVRAAPPRGAPQKLYYVAVLGPWDYKPAAGSAPQPDRSAAQESSAEPGDTELLAAHECRDVAGGGVERVWEASSAREGQSAGAQAGGVGPRDEGTAAVAARVTAAAGILRNSASQGSARKGALCGASNARVSALKKKAASARMGLIFVPFYAVNDSCCQLVLL